MIEFQGIQFDVESAYLHPTTMEELSSVEAELGCSFPNDYREFITTFGPGEMNFHVGAFSPRTILKILPETRERLSEYWFWREDPASLTQRRAVECIPFFDSCDGDDILFHPSEPNRWFILLHGEPDIITVHTFQQLCNFYIQKYEEDDVEGPFTPPFEFSP